MNQVPIFEVDLDNSKRSICETEVSETDNHDSEDLTGSRSRTKFNATKNLSDYYTKTDSGDVKSWKYAEVWKYKWNGDFGRAIYSTKNINSKPKKIRIQPKDGVRLSSSERSKVNGISKQ